MLRFLLIALPLIVCVVAGAFMLALVFPEASPEPVVIAEVPEPVGLDQAPPTEPPPPPMTTASVPPPPGAPARQLRNVTPPGVHRGAVRAFEERPPQPPRAAEPDRQRYARVLVETAGTLRVRDRAIRIAGIDAPEIDEFCKDATGQSWPCGRAAAAALQRLVRQRSVECEADRETRDDTDAHCTVAGTQIGEWLVRQGWARPADPSTMQAAADEARDGARGMYREQWQPKAGPVAMPEPFRPPGNEQAGPQDVPALY